MFQIQRSAKGGQKVSGKYPNMEEGIEEKYIWERGSRQSKRDELITQRRAYKSKLG